jgi:hypothetical protein
MKDMGLVPKVIRAGEANMFLSPVFRNTLATLCDASIELYNTDGSLGAARGAAWGAGHYESREACFAGLKCIRSEEPRTSWRGPLEMAYQNWKNKLEKAISNILNTIIWQQKNFFPEIGRFKFEGKENKNPLAFRYYDAEKVVLRQKDERLVQICHGLLAYTLCSGQGPVWRRDHGTSIERII